MSALARYFHSMGKQVAGYDRTATLLTDELIQEGIGVHFLEDPEQIAAPFTHPRETLVVYTPAVSASHAELSYFRAQGHTILKRSEVLGLITQSREGICVAGTHGKTTTSGLVAHMMRLSDLGCSAFLGGITNNYQTNFWSNPNSPYVVVEADEFDRSFLHLSPHLALITSMDADHLDVYGNSNEVTEAFHLFAGRVQTGGALVVKKGLPLNEARLDEDVELFTYALNDKSADFTAVQIKLVGELYRFNLLTPFGAFRDLELGIPGMHNLENAVGASALALLAGVGEEVLREALAGYTGNRRRFQYRIRRADLVFIDDYAHHPAEIDAMLKSVRQTYSGRHLTAVFQPHLFTRTRDFAREFALALSLADRVLVLDIYPARELPIQGVTAQMIVELMRHPNARHVLDADLFAVLREQPVDVLVTMGAGNIDALVPVLEEQLLRERE